MAKKTINLGVTPDGEGGDNLRSAFTKTNENFSELYRDKVSAEAGKQLSDENYTLAEKEKLSGVAVEATKNRDDSENADKEHTHVISDVTDLPERLNDIDALAEDLGTDVESINLKIGDLSQLPTQAKENLVDSLLEIVQALGKSFSLVVDMIPPIDDDAGLGDTGVTWSADKSSRELAEKVDKVAGMGLSDTNFTQAEKDKLSYLEGSKFVGLFVSESALPLSGSEGDYANVDGGVGSDVYRVIWDSSDNKWVRLQGVSTELTDAQIKQQYESNPDTNAFTDDEKAKLSGVAVEATKNRDDSENADKEHTHVISDVTGLSTRLSNIDALIGDVESVLVAINGEP